jgi:hypothetical protein
MQNDCEPFIMRSSPNPFAESSHNYFDCSTLIYRSVALNCPAQWKYDNGDIEMVDDDAWTWTAAF